jgi:chemotaxis-related protein WspD
MNTSQESAVGSPRTAHTDCWNSIGVRGDSSCPELKQHIHCRNCPVYSAAAVQLLDVEPPADYLAFWTRQVGQKSELTEATTHSVVVFRVGTEWLALPTSVLKEVVSMRAIHSLPHRRSGVVLGLANIRGELLVCFSLQHILALEQGADVKSERPHAVAARLLVIEREGNRAVCPVEEVHGIVHFRPGEVTPAPTTITKATTAYTQSVLSWQKRSVGLLNDQALFATVNRSLA